METEKDYPVQGTVTISTQEYKDLVTTSIKLESELSEMRSRCWRVESEKSGCEKKLEALQTEVNLLNRFIASSSERVQEWFTWRNSQEAEAD